MVSFLCSEELYHNPCQDSPKVTGTNHLKKEGCAEKVGKQTHGEFIRASQNSHLCLSRSLLDARPVYMEIQGGPESLREWDPQHLRPQWESVSRLRGAQRQPRDRI